MATTCTTGCSEKPRSSGWICTPCFATTCLILRLIWLKSATTRRRCWAGCAMTRSRPNASDAICRRCARCTLRRITIVEGKIIATTPFQRLVTPIAQAPDLQRVQVYDFNEKKTDVNLAADLIAGAWTGAYEQAVVCSNDSDLEAALATVRRHHAELRLGLVAPIPGDDHRRISSDLSRHVHWSKPLSPVHLRNAQLPERIPHSALSKPPSW